LEALITRLDIQLGDAVLDIGCGTGVLEPLLLNKIGWGGKVICLDYAEKMLDVARAKGFPSNVAYCCTDIEESGLDGASFDVAICYSVFPHFSDKPKALAEIYRLLKNKGRLFICHTASRQKINGMHRGLPEVRHCRLPGKTTIRCLLTAARFANIRIHEGADDYLVSAVKLV
jgi:ubiquinone/menaquinone biosynthesis C-methylase UbiE